MTTTSCIPLPNPHCPCLIPQAPSSSSQQLSCSTHSSLATSAVASVAPVIPATVTQLPEILTIMSTSTAGSSSSEGNPPIPWTTDEWNHIFTLVEDLDNERAQTSQQVPPAPQDGVLSPENVPISYYPQQVTSSTDQQTQAVATTTQELKLTRTTQQAPPQLVEISRVVPSSCNNVSKEQSLSVTMSAPHPGANSSDNSTSNNRISVAAAIQDLVTSKGSISTHNPDQRPECTDPSHPINSNNDEHHSNNLMAARDRSISPSQENPMDLIEKIVHDGSDLFGEVQKPFRQCTFKTFHIPSISHKPNFCRKRKFIATLENETDDENLPTPKNARKETGSRDESLMPLILLTCMHIMKVQRDTIEELKEGQKAMHMQLKNISEQLETLSGRQQVKLENSAIKTEVQDSCMGNALKDESNGVRKEDCCWNGNLNLLKIKSEDACKYALKLLDKLFQAEEMVGRCYRRGPNSLTKPLLDESKVKILENCVKYKFGLLDCNYEQDLIEKLNQKCRDAKRRVR